MKRLSPFFILLLCSVNLYAKEILHTFDAGYGFGKNGFLSTLSWKPMFAFLKDDALKIGVGVRYSGFVGDESVKYTRVDSGYSGSNSYELFINRPNVVSLNTAFEITYTFLKRFELGHNIDLFGYGFSRSKSGNYTSPTPANGATSSEAQDFNLLLFGRHDKGQLNSEFFVGYRCPFNLGIRAGFSHLVTEQKTETPLDGEDRFRHLGNFWFLSLNYLI